MALGKPSPLSIGLTVGFIVVVGYLVWQSTSKTDETTYTKGAQHTEQTTTLSPTAYYYPLSLGCAPIMRTMDVKTPDAEQKKVKK